MTALVVQTRPAFPGSQHLRGWGRDRDDLLKALTAAYAAIAAARIENCVLWMAARRQILEGIKAKFDAVGLEMAPLYWASFCERLAPSIQKSDSCEHVQLVEAVLTNATSIFWSHLSYRMETEGNVHLEFTGHTGMGKSSCALTVADWLSPIDAAKVEQHVNFDLGDLPKKLKTKRPRETVIQDEYVAASGEGARTNQSLFENLEDTLRASQINLFVLSPRRQQHATMQARMEALAWNRKEKFTAFLVWVEDQPIGLVAIPWCRAELYAAYKVWKMGNVERSTSGQFKDASFIPKNAMRCFEDPRVVKYLAEIVQRPKKTHFENAVSWFPPEGMMTITQKGQVAELMHSWSVGYDTIGPHIKDFWDVEPNDGLARVAAAVNNKD